jgi:hypothetical protein
LIDLILEKKYGKLVLLQQCEHCRRGEREQHGCCAF